MEDKSNNKLLLPLRLLFLLFTIIILFIPWVILRTIDSKRELLSLDYKISQVLAEGSCWSPSSNCSGSCGGYNPPTDCDCDVSCSCNENGISQNDLENSNYDPAATPDPGPSSDPSASNGCNGTDSTI